MTNPLNWLQDKIVAAANGQMVKLMETWGPQVADEARRLCRVDTGQTKDSIGWIMRQSDMTLQIYAGTWWAIYLEMGTSRMRAYPFLRPALNIIRGFGTGKINTEVGLTAPRADSGYRQHLSPGLRRTRGGQSKIKVRRYNPGLPLTGAT